MDSMVSSLQINSGGSVSAKERYFTMIKNAEVNFEIWEGMIKY